MHGLISPPAIGTHSLPFCVPCNEEPIHLAFTAQSTFGETFPLRATIDREGVAFSSFQLRLMKAFHRVRERLVHRSEWMFNLDDDSWLSDLMNYLNLAISLIDVTLHQVYYKAKYDGARMGWRFDSDVLGQTFGRRLGDKLRWVGQITGRPLSDAADEIKSLRKLKEVRNHINHFDPPLMAFSIEDVADWLNHGHAIARLLWKIRDRVNCTIPNPLIEMLLAPQVDFVPRDPGKPRHAQAVDAGYASSCWAATPPTAS